MLIVKTASLVLFSLLTMTLLLSTVFSSRVGTVNALSQSLICIDNQCQQTTVNNGGASSTLNQQTRTKTAPPPQYDGIQGNAVSQSTICTNNECQHTTCIDNQCQQTTVNNGGASSTLNQQTRTKTAPPPQR
jgi:hypothetical protein